MLKDFFAGLLSKPADAGKPLAASYTAANPRSAELAGWQPPLTSADRAMLPEKRLAEARAMDLVRNNGYARGAVQSQKDRVIGARYKLQLKPNYQLLGIDASAAAKWATQVEAAFHAYADDPDCWIDAQRKRTFHHILREAVASDMVQGEVFIAREWRPSPAGYATCFKTIAPERIRSPSGSTGEEKAANGNSIRAGVELDRWGAAVAYYVLDKHPQDVGLSVAKTQRITKNNEFGWSQMIHLFEVERPDQTRGFSSMASGLQKLKMMDMQEDIELQASQLHTAFAMYLSSAAGKVRLNEMMGNSEEAYQSFMQTCMTMQDDYYGANGVNINGVKLPVLMPDDEIKMVQPNNQPSNHEQFKQGLRQQVARGIGMPYEEFSGDYSQTSYSSARASMQMAWQYVLARRSIIADRLASIMFRAWFDEAIVRGAIPLPEGVTYWPNNAIENTQKFAWLTRCDWIGSGKVVIDEMKQAKANETMVKTGQASIMDVHAENGVDTETLLDQEVRYRQMREERGLPPLEGDTGQQVIFNETTND